MPEWLITSVYYYNSVPAWLNILMYPILLCILMSQNGSLFFSMIACQNGSLCQDGSIHLCMPQLLATSLHSQNGSILLCKTACKNVIVALHAYLPSMPQFCAYLSVPGLLTSLPVLFQIPAPRNGSVLIMVVQKGPNLVRKSFGQC